MAVQEIVLMWVPEGLDPRSSSTHYREPASPSIRQAVSSALRDESKMKAQGKLPWLRAGTGRGAAVLDIQGILLLDAAFKEARNA